MTALERASERPVSTSFFPAARISFVLGVLIAFAGIGWQRAHPPEQPVEEVAPAVDIAVAGDAPAAELAFPLQGPAIVYVWLENCADCMTAFAAHKRFVDAGAFRSARQYNVSYGGSTKEFRERYGVDTNYLADVDGSRVVRPNGIGSFTTLVIDHEGKVTHRDRPDHDGYELRVLTAHARNVARVRSLQDPRGPTR